MYEDTLDNYVAGWQYEDARYAAVWQYEEDREAAACGHIYSCLRTRDTQLYVYTYSGMRTHTQQYADTYTAVCRHIYRSISIVP